MGGGGTHQIAKSLRLPSTVKKINAKLKSRLASSSLVGKRHDKVSL